MRLNPHIIKIVFSKNSHMDYKYWGVIHGVIIALYAQVFYIILVN